MIVTIKSEITGKDYIAHTDEELTKCLKQMNEDDALYKKAHEQEDAEYEGVTNLYNAYTKALERYDNAKKEVQKILEESNAKMQEIISKAEKEVSDAYDTYVKAEKEFRKKYGSSSNKKGKRDREDDFKSFVDFLDNFCGF